MPLLAGHGLEPSMLFGPPCFLVAEQYSTTGKFVELSCTKKVSQLITMLPPFSLLGGTW